MQLLETTKISSQQSLTKMSPRHPQVTSAEPLLIGLFAGSDATSFPAMLIVPPAELFKSWYTFSTGHNIYGTFQNFVLVVIARSALPGLTLDGDTVDQTGWTGFPLEPETVGKAVPVGQGRLARVSKGKISWD